MDPLHARAARAGIEVRYQGWRGKPVEASREALEATLAALGHDDDAWWEAGGPPIVVGWDGADAPLLLRARADLDERWEAEITYEDGTTATARGRLFETAPSGHVERRGATWCLREARLPGASKLGYHRVRWRVGDRAGEARWIAAPSRAHPIEGRTWGAFAPLYALRTARSGATGDLVELARLARHVEARGGTHVATLPLLAAFLDEPCEPSPYAAASRQFWNELYLDVGEPAPPGLSAQPQIDYRVQYRWRRAVIDRLAAAAWTGPEAGELIAFAQKREVADYAAFRAIGEALRGAWSSWPAHLRDAPRFSAADVLRGDAPVDIARWQSHVWAQREMDRQLAGLGGALYLDLPVGVNRDAYDVWRRRELYVLDASTGAPPDALFLGGQDWGLPPLHPERCRAAGWDLVIAALRHHMARAGMLRIDHVMGLHRLYWVPAGLPATDGVYVRYPAEELYALVCLESRRHRCAVVGEDLGTVPDEVPRSMRAHGLARLHVAQFFLPALGQAAAGQVASLNTHDTPTFGGWWSGADVDDKLALGLIDDGGAVRERAERADARREVLAALGAPAVGTAPERGPDGHWHGPGDPDGDAAAAAALLGVTRDLARSDAPVVLVTVEDAWLEPRPQNVPGTAHERPNWRRPFALDADAALADPRLDALIDAAKR